MKAAVDLHIHSALSPCSDNEMTPNNIVNMALLKGLDIIAVTDHNCVENYAAFQKCAGSKILVVSGMEVESREEVHLICLFPGIREALEAQKAVHGALPEMENREDIFGAQLLFDEGDNIIGRCKRLLLTAANLSADDIFKMVEDLGGVTIPAHVDRQSYSMISNLGMIPEGLGINYLEISRGCDPVKFMESNPGLAKYKLIKSSDAHNLEDLLERESFLEIREISERSLIESLRFR